jgi:O-acetylhomoserine (thiol)-lyase
MNPMNPSVDIERYSMEETMNDKRPYAFETLAIHGALTSETWEGSTLPPIYQSAAHWHQSADSLSNAFAGKTRDHIYMRLTNPTNKVLEEKITLLEGGRGAIVTSSGMAAITITCMALLRTGDEFISGNSIFMSTYVLFSNIFKKYGIKAHFVEPTDPGAIRDKINEKTRFIFLESIGNPKMDVPDIKEVAEIAHHNQIPLIVDNTLATPYLCRPIELGADIVIHSTTKYLSGHGCATGGIVRVGFS